MDKFQTTGSRRIASAVLGSALIMLIITGSAGAQVLLQVPGDSPGAPIYARTDLEDGSYPYHTDEWAAIVFYRGPGCVPSGFNLLYFVDFPAAFDCELNISGFELWENGPGIDSSPLLTVSSGSSVPIWFVSWPALEAALTDNALTMPELESLNPLKGIATTFHEVLHPLGGSAKVPHLTITADGFFPDGRSFQYHFNSVEKNKPADNVKIAFR